MFDYSCDMSLTDRLVDKHVFTASSVPCSCDAVKPWHFTMIVIVFASF